MIEKIAATISRHSMFRQGDRVGAAVSGGPDSVCLLHVLLALRERWDVRISVVHLNHQLRGAASEGDARFVEQLAAQHGLPFYFESADVGSANDNLEQAARNVRLEFFRRLIAQGIADRIATGHTQSDQAETVLLRMLRGSGTTGLAGILPVTREGLVRPLLDVTRDEAQTWLKERNLEWRTDETNLDRRFVRNQVRLELLPELRREYNPRIDIQLAHMADLFREEDAFLEAETTRVCGFLQTLPGPVIVAEIAKLAEMNPAVRRRVLRRAIATVRGNLRQIEFEHIEAVWKVTQGAEGHARVIIPGVDAIRSFGLLRLAPPGLDAVESRIQVARLAVPGDTPLPGGRGIIRTRISSGLPRQSEYNRDQASVENWATLDREKASYPLELRYWLPGDQYQPTGWSTSEKLKQMFQKARIPLWERRFWPIIENRQGIVWTRRFGPSAAHGATQSTKEVIEIVEISPT